MDIEMQEKIKMLLSSRARFVANGRYECYLCSNHSFSTWMKDDNSPAFFSEAEVCVKDLHSNDGKMCSGLALVQEDKTLLDPLSLVLYLRFPGSKSKHWDVMHLVNELDDEI